jgi:hypothetical protein
VNGLEELVSDEVAHFMRRVATTKRGFHKLARVKHLDVKPNQAWEPEAVDCFSSANALSVGTWGQYVTEYEMRGVVSRMSWMLELKLDVLRH